MSTAFAADESARQTLSADASDTTAESACAQTSRGGRSALVPLAVVAIAALLSAPAHAIAPDGRTAQEPYAYPAGAEEPQEVPSGWLRIPAAAFDLLVVRPVMLGGLAAGAAFFIVVLPVQAPASAADESAAALLDQAKSTFTRPLGRF